MIQDSQFKQADQLKKRERELYFMNPTCILLIQQQLVMYNTEFHYNKNLLKLGILLRVMLSLLVLSPLLSALTS